MTVELIAITPVAGGDMQFLTRAVVEAGRGIVGDRHYRREGAEPGQSLTLIEAEAIEAFNRQQGTAIALGELRRNLVTRGVGLNDLVGRRFVIGSVHLRGVELCEPCARLGELLATATLTPPQVVAALVGCGGLRADVLRGGEIHPGDTLRCLA